MVGGDLRDDLTWVVIELSRVGEQHVAQGTIEKMLRNALDLPADHQVFIPAITYVRGGERVVNKLMEGYVFVASGLPETHYIALEDQPFVRKVLRASNRGFPVLSVIPNAAVEDMRQQLRTMVADDILVGMKVRVTQGTFTHLDGEVIDIDKDNAQVYIALRSYKVIRTIPRMFLIPLEGADEP